jgi:nucleoside-diphosphate-sugar epimerase
VTFWLVTGGAGFIGSNLVEALVKRGERTRVVDSLVTGRLDNLKPFETQIDFIKGDLRDGEICREAVKGADVILHQAALGSVPRSVADPLTTHDSNITATVNLLIAAREAGVKRIVCASSSSVYGANPELPKREDMVPMPISPYAVSKLAQEQYCMAFHAVYNMDTVALRYFNIYGPRQDPGSAYAAAIPLFIRAALKGRQPTIYGDGEQTRDFTFVGDCVEANLAAAEAGGVAGKIMNIAGGMETSVNKLWEIIRSITGTDIEPVYAEPRKGDVKRSFANVSGAGELMGWQSRTDLESGLRKTVDWIKENE